MNSRERVLIALQRGQADRVPYCELAVDRTLASEMMGLNESSVPPGMMEVNLYTVEEYRELVSFLGLDNITMSYAHRYTPTVMWDRTGACSMGREWSERRLTWAFPACIPSRRGRWTSGR